MGKLPKDLERTARRDRVIHVTAEVLLSILLIGLSWSLRTASAEKAELGWRLAVDELRSIVVIPDEALYCDDQALQEIAQIRQRLFKDYASSTLTPYSLLRDRNLAPSKVLAPAGVHSMPAADTLNLAAWSLEGGWALAARQACRWLAAEVEAERGLGRYLTENRDVYQHDLHPAIVRLLRSRWPQPRWGASEALLALGHRTDEVVSTLRGLTNPESGLSESERTEVQALIARYGLTPAVGLEGE